MERLLLNFIHVVEAEYASQRKLIMKRYGLLAMEVEVLMFLDAYPEKKTASEITKWMRASKSHVSLAVNSLADRNYITRKEDEKNRKRVLLYLTDKAKEVVDDSKNQMAMFNNDLYSGMNLKEKKQIEVLLKQMVKNAETVYQHREKRQA